MLEVVGRISIQEFVNVREVLAIQHVEIAVVGRRMLGSVPPVPVAALGNQQFLVGKALLFSACGAGMMVVEVSGLGEVVPGEIVFRSADPNVEVGVDPGTRNE